MHCKTIVCKIKLPAMHSYVNMALFKQNRRARNVSLGQMVNFLRAISGTHGSTTVDTDD